MARIFSLLVGATLALALAPVVVAGDPTGPNPQPAPRKVTICHVPPGNPDAAHTITISRSALRAHLGDNPDGLHGGDYIGECESTGPVPSPTPSPTDEPGAGPVDPQPTGGTSSTSATRSLGHLPQTDTVQNVEPLLPISTVIVLIAVAIVGAAIGARATRGRR